MPHVSKTRLLLLCALTGFAPIVRAELKLTAIFSDHMVLQRELPCSVWGWDDPGTAVTVDFGDQHHQAVAGPDGRWAVSLTAMPASAQPRSLEITGTSRRKISDVLVGEVWLCSGQSNMARTLPADWNGDLAALAAANDQIRLIRVPAVGTQEPQADFKGAWTVATPESVRRATAIGYYFGDYLQRTLHVPVGLIDNSWGGSAADAWVDRRALEAAPRFSELIRETVERETYLATATALAQHEVELAAWQVKKDAGNPVGRKPAPPDAWFRGNKRAGNLFAGVLHPLIGYGIKGTIWYQGEANTDRAAQYTDLFPFMIQNWREAWGQGDFPFYWVQLADYQMEVDTPRESAWAELRESQTKTLQLSHTGQAVIIDLGEASDIHPRHKHDVAARLARLALAQDYGFELPHQSPRYRDHRIVGGKMIITIDVFGSQLRPFDTRTIQGFAICGEDRVWHWADAKLTEDNAVVVWSDDVPAPFAVRYAWANNPVCNLISTDGLPVTPFRTDDFLLSTAGIETPQ